MTFVHLINSELGGMGKTTFCSAFYEFCQQKDKNIDVELIDVDRSNPNVGIKYLPEEYSGSKEAKVFFSENKDEKDLADEILEKALESDLLINLPSQILKIFDNWVEKNQIFVVAKREKIQFVNWYVTNGSYHSVRLFKNFVKKHQDNMIHIMVRNTKLCRNWEQVDEDSELEKLIELYQIESLELPTLDDKEMYLIEKYNLGFLEATKSPKLKLLQKQRAHLFIDALFENIEATSFVNEILLEVTDSEEVERKKRDRESSQLEEDSFNNGYSDSFDEIPA